VLRPERLPPVQLQRLQKPALLRSRCAVATDAAAVATVVAATAAAVFAAAARTAAALLAAAFLAAVAAADAAVAAAAADVVAAAAAAVAAAAAGARRPAALAALVVACVASAPPRAPRESLGASSGGSDVEVRTSSLEDRGSRLSGLRGPSSSPRLGAARKICAFAPWEGSGNAF